ncbi:hypothetical protein KY284_032418 [Solanum tuberosum]|nr:hypothetical protein KY284_032418 [Solanum tuberosum]
MDSVEAIKLLENMHPTYRSIILHCRSILKKLGNLVVRHSLRQGNKVADILSRLGCKLTHTNNPCILLSPPDIFKKKLKEDRDEVTSSKIVVQSTCNS